MEDKNKKDWLYHLYYNNNKIRNQVWEVISWKRYRWWWDDKEDPDNVVNKDYSRMKANFTKKLDKFRRDFWVRYNHDTLQKRKELNLIPELYLKITTFKKNILDKNKIFFKNLGMQFVSYDETISEYTVKMDIDKYNQFEILILDFINRADWEKFIWNENLLKLFYDFNLVTNELKYSSYYDYFIDNWELSITLFDDSFDEIQQSLLILNSNLKTHIDYSNKKIILKSWILNKVEFEILLTCFDWIKKVSASNMKIQVDKQWNINSDKPNFQIKDTEVNELVCVVDSWIDSWTILNNYIEKKTSLNLSHIWINPLSDSKALIWHWTNVAWIIIFWNQINNKLQELTPLCKVCSLQIIWPGNETTIDYRKVVDDIKSIHLNSWKNVKIFNLSFSTECLKNNEISDFSLSLDSLMHEYDILCVISAWNHTKWDMDYPMWWLLADSNITSPAESINWITVGSIWDSIFWPDYVSSYSRKDNICYPMTFSEKFKDYRKKPDILAFGGYKNQELLTLWPSNALTEVCWTSFATPFVTHLLLILKSFYANITMNSLKWLLINSCENVIIDETIFNKFLIDKKKLYWNWIVPAEKIDNWEFMFSNDNKVTILIESEMNFSDYSFSNYPFLNTKIKMPQLRVKRWEHVQIKATICYNPLVNLTDNLWDYNTCFLWFRLHSWNDDFKNNWKGVTELTQLSWERWSWKPFKKFFWHNCKTESFTFTKNSYNNLVLNDLSITIKWVLKEDSLVEEWYKEHPQKFSLIITIEDMWKEWTMYNHIKTENQLNSIVENYSTLDNNLKL